MIRNRIITPRQVALGVRRRIGDVFFKKLFRVWERFGFHISRNHFYEPIPDTRTLSDTLWQRNSGLAGIDMNDEGQLSILEQFAGQYKAEYDGFKKNRFDISQPYEFYLNNEAFLVVDAEILYCMIRHFKPKRMYEIGSGFTTYLSASALLINEKETHSLPSELVAFEPYPNSTLLSGFPGLSKLVPKKIQEIPIDEFNKLEENDILFIDSSHVLKIGSDVQYEYLEILPRLNKGVIVHIHDIFLPAEYPKTWVLGDYRFWNEQYILQAFLAFNDHFQVLWGGNYMHLKYSAHLKRAIQNYDSNRTLPGSFWIRKIK